MSDEYEQKTAQTLSDLLERKAEKLGDSTLFHFEDTEYSYDQINQNANAIASHLQAFGVKPGDVVGIFMYNRPEYIYTIFGLSKIGAVAAPIDTRFSGDALVHIFSETDAKVVFLDERTKDSYEAVRDSLPNVGLEVFAGSGDIDGSYREFEQLLTHNDIHEPNVEVAGADTCSIIYIQRYERKYPQGVMLPHYSYINTGTECTQNLFSLGSEDCIFTTLPFYSSYPIQMGLTGAMIAEAEFSFARQFQRETFWNLVRAYDATMILYLGRMLSVLHNQERKSKDNENPAKYAFGYGFGVETDESMIAEFEERFDITVIQGYGITPTATVATSNRPESRKLGSVGTPISYADVKIVDEDDWFVPTGETGEIVVRSERPNTMMSGFFNDSTLLENVCRNQWIHTNDIGYKDEDGFVHFVGRKSDTIELGRVAGRISSLEIESIIDTHPSVSESVVLGVLDQSGEEAIKAVVATENDDLSPIDISAFCEQRLDYHKLPRYIEIRGELPRSSTGKIRKEALKQTNITEGIWDRERGYSLSQ